MEPTQAGLRRESRFWRSRQQTDGYLVASVAAVAILGLGFFVYRPGEASATVLVVSLVAVILACARLIQSAANVVRIRTSIRLQVAIADSIEVAGKVSSDRLN